MLSEAIAEVLTVNVRQVGYSGYEIYLCQHGKNQLRFKQNFHVRKVFVLIFLVIGLQRIAAAKRSKAIFRSVEIPSTFLPVHSIRRIIRKPT